MVSFPFEDLDDFTFEQLAVALSRAVMGPGVTVFGKGPDGGREATFEGRVDWSNARGLTGRGTSVDVWDGYVVIQAKHHNSSDLDPARNLTWLKKQIDTELDSWIRRRRGRFPQYLLVVSNAHLSAVENVGGIDEINAHVRERFNRELKERGMKDWAIWHRDQVTSLLINYEGVRKVFSGLLTQGDLLDRLRFVGVYRPDDMRALLVTQAQSAIRAERATNFSEAGSDARFALDQIVVDLPVRHGEVSGLNALPQILKAGEPLLRRTLVSEGTPRHLLLTGAPGNGKSTLSKFVTQTYRARFLASEALPPQEASIVGATGAALKRLGVNPPTHQRWPIRIDLARMATENTFGEVSFLNWLGHHLSKRSPMPIKAADLEAWMRAWPWVVVFDGLDEVTAPAARQVVINTITDFINDVDSLDADVYVVVTTRPTGYTEELPTEHFNHYALDNLSLAKAKAYGKHVIAARLAKDADRHDQVLDRFLSEVKDRSTQRLLKTPLQVLIITVILERLGSLPPDRYSLFWRYFDTVYDRESAKQNDLATLLSTHRADITYLHEVIGLALQHRSERGAESAARMKGDTLRQLATRRLLNMGHEPGNALDQITERILDAVRSRLVLLVPGGDDTVMFEVRSLQELMASRALTMGSEEDMVARLSALLPSPHWRNTWVFMAGRIFADPDERKWDLVTSLLTSFKDASNWPEWLTPTVPGVAAQLLDDGLAAQKPRWQRQLLELALTALQEPVPPDLNSIAQGLSVAAAEQASYAKAIENAMRGAAAGPEPSRAAVGVIWHHAKFPFPIPAGIRTRATLIDLRPGRIRGSERVNAKTAIKKTVDELGGSMDTSLADAALEDFDGMATARNDADHTTQCFVTRSTDWSATKLALQDPETRVLLQLSIGALSPSDWPIRALIGQEVFAAWARTEVNPEALRLPPDVSAVMDD